MWESSRVVGELVDVEEEGTRDVAGQIAGAGVCGGCYSDGRQCGVEEYCIGVVEAAGEPGGIDE
jgi:hypothetical protein